MLTMADEQQQSAQPGLGERSKPDELLRLASVSAELFNKLKSWFMVPDLIIVPLSSVGGDNVISDLQDAQKVVAFAMRKLQALHLTAQPSVLTRSDVPLSLIDAVLRALVEAPSRHLTYELATTDWDQEGQLLEDGLVWKRPPADTELPRFNALIDQLCSARPVLITLLRDGTRYLRRKAGPGKQADTRRLWP